MPLETEHQKDVFLAIVFGIVAVVATLTHQFTKLKKAPAVTELLIYPVKSCGEISVPKAKAEVTGFEHDRIFQVSTAKEIKYCTPRNKEYVKLFQVKPKLKDDASALVLTAPNVDEPLEVPIGTSNNLKSVEAQLIMGPNAKLDDYGSKAAAWLETAIGCPKDTLRLTGIGKEFNRTVEVNPDQEEDLPPTEESGAGTTKSGSDGHPVSLADEAPFLLCSESSLRDLNTRMKARGKKPIDMRRFRPNIVLDGFPAWAEDTWKRIRIGSVEFHVWQRCGRCALTTIDRDTCERGPEPLATLSTFRERAHGQRNFGMHMIPVASTCPNTINVGDTIEILEYDDERLAEWKKLFG